VRLRRLEKTWLIPVRFDDCEINSFSHVDAVKAMVLSGHRSACLTHKSRITGLVASPDGTRLATSDDRRVRPR
jgi:hypothetical protein